MTLVLFSLSASHVPVAHDGHLIAPRLVGRQYLAFFIKFYEDRLTSVYSVLDACK